MHLGGVGGGALWERLNTVGSVLYFVAISAVPALIRLNRFARGEVLEWPNRADC